jgi:hypothetical protein
MRTTRTPWIRRSGHPLSRALWKILNRKRPVAGRIVYGLRGSPVKSTGDFAR